MPSEDKKPLGLFARYLTIWVFSAIVAGIALGSWFAPAFHLLGCLFQGCWFVPLLDTDKIPEYIGGLILLAAAPCTAMVFVWSRLGRRPGAIHIVTGHRRTAVRISG